MTLSFHTPVFVLTHYLLEPLEMEGGTTFTLLTGGIGSALEQARQAAGGLDVLIGEGASAVQEYLAAGLIEEFELHMVPILLGAGERLPENVGNLELGAGARSRRPASPTSRTFDKHELFSRRRAKRAGADGGCRPPPSSAPSLDHPAAGEPSLP